MNELDNVRLTESGCRERIGMLFERLHQECQAVILSDPRHIGYLSGFFTNLGTVHARSQSFLVIDADGRTVLITDAWQAEAAREAHVDSVEEFVWYDEKAPAHNRRRLALQSLMKTVRGLASAPSSIGVELSAVPSGAAEALRQEYPGLALLDVWDHLLEMRLRKWPDEVECLKRAARACEAGYVAARRELAPGLTEVELYSAAFAAALSEAGEPIVAMGDFLSGPERTAAMAGPPTRRAIEAGDLVIMDFFVLLQGYRADLCNTFLAGGEPLPEQQRRLAVLHEALAAAEEQLRPGASAAGIHAAVARVAAEAGLADAFVGHAGHGVGLDQPEAPFLVPESTETLLAGNVVTVEPGLYQPGWGGMRIEDNYLITASGFERLSRHVKQL